MFSPGACLREVEKPVQMLGDDTVCSVDSERLRPRNGEWVGQGLGAKSKLTEALGLRVGY